MGTLMSMSLISEKYEIVSALFSENGQQGV